MKIRIVVFFLVFAGNGFWTPPGRAQQPSAYRLENIPSPPAGISESIAQALQPQGVRLVGPGGKIIGELWLRATIPLKPNAAGYSALSEGTLVGVLHLPQGGSDFRGQPIPPGIYTLRYERIPEDGNHLGAAPQSHFLLLCPGGSDSALDAALDFDSLMTLSRQTTGTNHPAPLMLLPVPDRAAFPAIEGNDLGHIALRAQSLGKPSDSASTKDFALALVLVGKAEL